MIDIHTHILPFLDDGSPSIERSLEMLEREAELGVTDVILTPHHRFDFKHGKKEIIETYNQFVQIANQKRIGVNLYLGQELLIDRRFKEFMASGELITLNDTKYVLIEFNLSAKQNFIDPVYEFVRLGYKPIVAHFERYFYSDLDLAYQIKDFGGLIQLNARSILGENTKQAKKLCKQLFKAGLVDFVASDVHHFRENLMADCYRFVGKKFGEEVADKVFIQNAQNIIKG